MGYQKNGSGRADSERNVLGVSQSSKQQKPNRVPLRGPGIAELEKIRIEKLKKREAAAVAALAATGIFPSQPPIHQGAAPLANPGKSDAREMGRLPGAAVMHGNVPKIWNSTDLGTQLETPAVNPALAQRPNSNPSYESGHALPLPGPILRLQPEHLDQLNNVIPPPAPTPSQSSTLSNFQMEPPSNQNYHHNNSYSRMAPEVNLLREDVGQVAGKNRPRPSSRESLPRHPPLRPDTAHHADHFTGSISHGGGSRSVYHYRIGNFRYKHQETLSLQGSSSARESNLTEWSRENGFPGDFLRLAPPSASSTWLSPKQMDLPPASASNNQSIFLDHESHDFHQGHAGELGSFLKGSRETVQQHQYYYNFLPPASPQDTRAVMDSKTCSGEDQESIDLKLRL